MWGQVVESKLKPTDTPCFSLAPNPPKAIEDIRAMNIELTLNLDTPMDLYNRLKQFTPTPGGVFRLSKVEDLWGNIPKGMTRQEATQWLSFLTPAGREALLAQPRLNWHQIFKWV